LGDVRDRDRLEAAMVGHDVVIHAAAMKYIPEGEMNVRECIAVNVDGARSVAQSAVRGGVRRVVGISTDKACEPVNVYGMTKALSERLFAEMSQHLDTTFTTVRYGNVVGSTGSVIPLFQRQLAERGRLTVTDPKMTRFWMSVDDAIDCIGFALDPARIPGSVTVPTPQAMTIGKLASCIAGDAPIDLIGARPGEKMHETLIHYQESVRVVEHSGYYELVPIGYGVLQGCEAFTVASHTPPRGMVSEAAMLRMIGDARDV
jgi:UDP-N-acetylglucosamine 4,6-dehydratase